jgi:hypothetical protein
MNATKSIDLNLNTVTLTFPNKPPGRILAALKSNGWLWSKQNRYWHAEISDDNHRFAEAICAGQIPETTRPAPRARRDENRSSDGGMSQANEEAYFDNFCRNNGI